VRGAISNGRPYRDAKTILWVLQPDPHKKYHGVPPVQLREHEMTIASDLLQQHIQTLVDDNA
jgi:hypothetical protein